MGNCLKVRNKFNSLNNYLTLYNFTNLEEKFRNLEVEFGKLYTNFIQKLPTALPIRMWKSPMFPEIKSFKFPTCPISYGLLWAESISTESFLKWPTVSSWVLSPLSSLLSPLSSPSLATCSCPSWHGSSPASSGSEDSQLFLLSSPTPRFPFPVFHLFY